METGPSTKKFIASVTPIPPQFLLYLVKSGPVPVQPGLLRRPHAVPVLQGGPLLSRRGGEPDVRMFGRQVLVGWLGRRYGLQLPGPRDVPAKVESGDPVRVRQWLLPGLQLGGDTWRLDMPAVQARGVLL